MRRRIGPGALACLLAALIACGCAAPTEIAAQTYVVQPGDTLYSIAWRHDVDFNDLAAWNNLGPSLRIEPGQILRLTPGAAADAGAGSAGRVRRDAPRVAQPPATAQSPRASQAPRTSPPPRTPQPPRAAAAGAWVWPTRGRGAPTPVPGGGVLLLGDLGQDVVASAAGKVVYVGSGLRGYGNLVIIKHTDALLSAYAHNQQVAVREGQLLKAGERIGSMGLGPRQIPALYFEIRQNGKPVDVAPYLGAK